MIILKQIKINDFLSHKDTTISLEKGDRLLLDGESGSGKSSIIEALLWCLYGRGRVDNRSLIRRGADEAIVSVVLYDDEKELSYQIIRHVTNEGKHTVNVLSGQDSFDEIGTGGITDTNAYIIREILGASYELFINSVVFPQDNVESFVTASSIHRKELLLEILKTESIKEYFDRTKELIDKKETNVIKMTGEISSSTAMIESNENKMGEIQPAYDKLAEFNISLQTVKDDYAVARVNKDATDAAYEAVKEDEVKLSALKRGVRSLPDVPNPEELLSQCQGIIKDELNVRAEYTAAVAHNEEIGKMEVERGHNRNDYRLGIQVLERQLASLVDGVLPCPAGDECPHALLVEPEIAELKKEISARQEDQRQQELAMKEWDKKFAEFGPRVETAALFDRMSKIDNAHNQISGLNAIIEQRKVQEEIRGLEQALIDAPTVAEVDTAREVFMELIVLVSKLESKIAEVRGEINYLERKREETKTLTEQIKSSTKKIAEDNEEIEILDELKEALGTKGIPAVALDLLLPDLEDRINEILGMLSEFRITLSTQKQGAGDNMIEGLFVTVKNEMGEEFDFNSYSGGERVRISVAISEALATMSNVGFRIMDETVQALDENMVENFVAVLTEIQSRYPQTICISHLLPVKDMFDNRLMVNKLDGVSSVVVI